MKKLLSIILIISIALFSYCYADDDTSNGGEKLYGQQVGETVADLNAAFANATTGGNVSDGYVISNLIFAQQFDGEHCQNAAEHHPIDSVNGDSVPHLSDTFPIYTFDGSSDSPANQVIGNFFNSLDPSQPYNFTITVQQVANVETGDCDSLGQMFDMSSGSDNLIPGTQETVNAQFVFNEKTNCWELNVKYTFTDKDHIYKMLTIQTDEGEFDIPDLFNSKYFASHGGNPGDPNNPNTPNTPPDKPSNPYGKAYYSLDSANTPFNNVPSASAHIDNPGDYYIVSEAIPTSEELEGHASAVSSVYNINARTWTYSAGYSGVNINATVFYTWETEERYKVSGEYKTRKVTHTESVSDQKANCKFDYSFNYYDVPLSKIAPLTGGSASAKKDSYSVGSVSLGAGEGGPGPQTLNFIKNFTAIDDVTTSDTVSGTSESDAKAKAEARLPALINETEGGLQGTIIKGCTPSNTVDYSFKGLTVNSGGISGSPSVGNVTSSQKSFIPSNYPNGTYVGDGSARWLGGLSVGMAPNSVVVHTPVVNRTTKDDIVSEKFLNQIYTFDSSTKYLQLDKTFTVTIPNDGQHINAKGYGNKRYNTSGGYTSNAQGVTNWGKYKDFSFNFDTYVVYNENATTGEYSTFFLPSGTWLSQASGKPDAINLTNNTQKFLIPVWAQEGNRKVFTRVIAENGDFYSPKENDANKTIMNYIAYKEIDVVLVGKIYDLQINNSNDRDWETKVQSQVFNKDAVLANEFPFGLTQKGRNNLYSSISNVKSQNKNNSYAYAPKLGSAFIFNFKTKGRKSNSIDISVADNKFYFVSKNGGDAEEVNLYYQKDGQYKKIGNGADIGLKIAATDSYLGIPSQELSDSNRIYPNEGISKYNYSSKVNIGTLSALKLPHSLRMCYNNFDEYMTDNRGQGLYKQIKQDISADAKTTSPYSSETGEDRVIGSVGRWYAGYALPTTTVAFSSSIPENQAIGALNRNDKSKALTDGYIIVLFDIKSLSTDGNYLKYYGPEARFTTGNDTGKEDKPVIDWTIDKTTPNGKLSIILPNGKSARVPNGAVTMYEAGATTQVETTKDIIY